jgi:dipeptidyl-peptidase-4
MRRIGLVAATGGEITWLALGGDRFDILHGWQWSPTGSQLLLDVSDVFVKHRRLMVATVGAGAAAPALRTLVEERDSANVSAEWQAAWAPDGAGVYFTSDRRTDYHIWFVPARGGAPRAITSGEWAVFGFTVTPRGLFVTANAGRPEERHTWRFPLGGGTGTRVSVHPGTHSPVPSPDGRWVADLFSSDTIPPDLHLLDGTGRDDAGRRVTVSPLAELARYRFTAPRYVTFTSRADGATLHARLLLPPGRASGARVPLIVGSSYSNTVRNQWGGRNAHPLWGLDQVLLEKGFAILAVDVAGSSGHGTAFRRRIRLDYGGIDVEDLHSGVEWAVREGIADSARVGIWGSSYGGLLTTMSMFTKPGVYRAGVAGAPATNVWHALTGEQRVMMRPQEQMAEYAAASSHTKADGLRGALMIIHGVRDPVVLYRDSAWLTQYLIQMGREVELVTLPDAGHGWDLEGLAQTRYAFKRLVGYFMRWLD